MPEYAYPDPGYPRDADPCPYSVDVSAWVDGELAPFEADALDAHLEACLPCAAELSELQRLRVQLRSLPLRRVPEGLWEAAATQALAYSKADSHRRRSERLALTGLALAVGVAGALAWPQAENPTRTVEVPVEEFVVDHLARTGGAPLDTVGGPE